MAAGGMIRVSCNTYATRFGSQCQAARLVYEVFGHLRTGARATVQVRNEQYDFSSLSDEELERKAIKLRRELEKMVGVDFSEPELAVPLRRP